MTAQAITVLPAPGGATRTPRSCTTSSSTAAACWARKHPAEAEVDLLRVDAIVGDVQPASQTGEKVDDPLGEASGKVEPLEVLADSSR